MTRAGRKQGTIPMHPILKPVAAAFAAFLVLAVPATAQVTSERIPSLTANGEGWVAVVPDIAIVTIGVLTRGATAREALDRNSAEIARVIEKVRGAGVADRDIATSGFSVSPVYEMQPPRAAEDGIAEMPRIAGYQVMNEVRVTIRDIGKSGAILDEVVTAGANQVSGIQFDFSDPGAAADEALRKAIADARRKAELMAASAGVRIVRILDISGGGAFPPMFARAEAMAFDKSVPVMPGEQRITANATLVFEIGQ